MSFGRSGFAIRLSWGSVVFCCRDRGRDLSLQQKTTVSRPYNPSRNSFIVKIDIERNQVEFLMENIDRLHSQANNSRLLLG